MKQTKPDLWRSSTQRRNEAETETEANIREKKTGKNRKRAAGEEAEKKVGAPQDDSVFFKAWSFLISFVLSSQVPLWVIPRENEKLSDLQIVFMMFLSNIGSLSALNLRFLIFELWKSGVAYG